MSYLSYGGHSSPSIRPPASLPANPVASFCWLAICCSSLHIWCNVHSHMCRGFNSPGTHEDGRRRQSGLCMFSKKKCLIVMATLPGGVSFFFYYSRNAVASCCSIEMMDWVEKLVGCISLSLSLYFPLSLHPRSPPPLLTLHLLAVLIISWRCVSTEVVSGSDINRLEPSSISLTTGIDCQPADPSDPVNGKAILPLLH